MSDVQIHTIVYNKEINEKYVIWFRLKGHQSYGKFVELLNFYSF